jgi:nicotinamidase-related amidase
MTATEIDPTTALIVVDLQNAIRAYSAAPIDGVISTTARLAEAFRAHDLPIVWVTVSGGAPGRTERVRAGGRAPVDNPMDVIAELGRQPHDLGVVKRTWGAFTGTDLDQQLRDRGVTQVVLAGIATSAGVESTARHAHENGYNVTLATDAMTDASAEAHDYVVSNVFPRIGETGTTDEIIALLDSRAK